MPQDNNDPQPLFAKDIHLDATGMWAKEVGFDDAAALSISESCNAVDGDWWDEGLKWFLSGSGNAGYYHYMTDKPENRHRDWFLAEKIIMFRFQKACRLMSEDDIEQALIAFGKGLHTFQDRFSHTLEDGTPMTDSDHGRFIGTDNIEKHPDKLVAVRNASIKALVLLFYRKEKFCSSAECSGNCNYWSSLANPSAPKNGLPEWR